ncbi:MAG: DNA-3-methyladenine glycosylase I [Dehalococcoidia bacterium]
MPGAPKQVRPKGSSDYLEVMSKAVLQAGISWAVVEKKWPGIREAFSDFDPLAVASIDGKRMTKLAQDPRVIRNRRKLEAIVGNARQMIDLEEQHGSFKKYLRSHGGFEATVADLRKRFKFLGETGCYFFLYVVGEPVPEYHAWSDSRGKRPVHP